MEKRSGSLVRAMVEATRKTRAAGGNGTGRMTYFMSLRQGMQQLVDGCVEFVGKERVRTSCEATQVVKTDLGYEVTAGSERMFFDAVVLAAPAYEARRLLGRAAPQLCDRLSEIEWTSTATVSLAFEASDIPVSLPGFGFIVPRVEGRRINAATWSSLKWSFRAPPHGLLIRSFVGGGRHEELVSYEDKDLVAVIRQELGQIAGIAAQPLFWRVYRWEKSMPRYTVGHLDRMDAIDNARRAGCPGLWLIGCSFRGIGIGDCVKSGLDAAREAAAFCAEEEGRETRNGRP
jgi:oxygen-dependent protoporphyrinogen oxidase